MTQSIETSKDSSTKGMTAEGLVELPEGKEAGVGNRVVAGFVLVCSALILLVTAYIDSQHPLDKPKLRGGERTRYNRMEKQAKWTNGSMARYIEHTYRIRSRVRDFLAKPYAGFLMRNLHETNAKVLFGSGGWMYWKDRVVLPEDPIGRGVARAAAEHAALARRFAALGVRLVAVPLPRKAVIGAEFLPHGFKGHREVDEAIITAFRARGVETIDLLETWSEPGPEPVYQRRDPHWSTEGIRRTALETTHQLGLLVDEESRMGTIRVGPDRGPEGAFYRINNTTPLESESQYAEKAALKVIEGGADLEVGSNEARIAVCGTSFTERDDFARFLSHYMNVRVQSIGLAGKPPQASLLRLLENRADHSLPEIVFEEIPNYQLVNHSKNPNSWNIGKPAVDLLVFHHPDRVVPLDIPVPILWKGIELKKSTLAKERTRLVRVPPGWIAHSGGGVVELAIELNLIGGRADLHLNHQVQRLSTSYRKKHARYFLPMITPTPNAESISLYFTPTKTSRQARFELGSVALVSSADSQTAIFSEVLPPVVEQNVCTQALRFPSSHTLSAQETLVIKTQDGKGAWLDVQVAVENSTGDQVEEFRFSKLNKGGWIVVVPGSLQGQELGTVTVSAKFPGKANRLSMIADARLLLVRGNDQSPNGR